MPTLYDLTQEQLALREMAENAESPEEVAALVDTLEASDALLAQKVEGYVAVFRSLHAVADMREEEARRLSELARSDRSKGDALKGRLLEALQSIGKTRLETPSYRITVAKGVSRADISDDKVVAALYGVRKETVSIDRKRLLEDLKAGRSVAGAQLTEGKPSLRIK